MGDISFLQKGPQHLRPSSEKFKRYGFIPTNFLKWEQFNTPKAGAIISGLFLSVLSLVLLYTVISYLAPHIDFDESRDAYHWWHIDDPLDFDIGYSWSNDRDKALEDYHDDLVPFFTVPLIGILIFSAFLIFFIKKIPQRVINPTPIKEFADYVQRGYSGRVYSFFLKDGKMGLLNSKTLTAQLNPVYDKLKWKEKNRFLEAEKDGTFFVIDINGNILK